MPAEVLAAQGPGLDETSADTGPSTEVEPSAKRPCVETRLTIQSTVAAWKPSFDVVARPGATWGDVKGDEQFTSEIAEPVLARAVGVPNLADSFRVQELGDGAVITIRKRKLVSGGVRALRDLEAGRRASSHLARNGEVLTERADKLNLVAHTLTRVGIRKLGRQVDAGQQAVMKGQQEASGQLAGIDKKLDLLLRDKWEVQSADVANMTALEQRKLASQRTGEAHALARSAKQRQADERAEARLAREAIANAKAVAAAAAAREQEEAEALCVSAYFE